MLMLSAALAAATCLIHLFLGGARIARPLLEATGLRTVPKLTLYYCWHMVTILLAGLAGMLLAAALLPAPVLAWTALAFTLSFALLSLAIVAVKRVRPLHMPQWLLFLLIGAAIGGHLAGA